MNKIKVLVVEPKKAPYVKEIDNTLEAKQEIVGGWIEQVTLPKDNVVIICNEEGKVNHLPYNRALYDADGKPIDILCGTFLLCLAPPDIESYASLTDELIEKYRKRFSISETISVSEEDKSLFVLHQPLDDVELIYGE
jgi:hypothetical protein